MARALAAERDGGPEGALALLVHVLDPDYMPFVPEDRCYLMSDVARLAVAVGDRATARSAAASARTDSEQEAVPTRGAVAGHCQGLLDEDPAPVLAAVATYRRVGRRLLLAQADGTSADRQADLSAASPGDPPYTDVVAVSRAATSPIGRSGVLLGRGTHGTRRRRGETRDEGGLDRGG